MKPIDIIPGTKVQYNKRHRMRSAFLTLTKGQGHIARSKVTDVEVSAFSECFLVIYYFVFILSRLRRIFLYSHEPTIRPYMLFPRTNVGIDFDVRTTKLSGVIFYGHLVKRSH